MTWRGLPWWRIALRIVGVAVTLLLVAAFGFIIYLGESLSTDYEDHMATPDEIAELEAELASKGSAEAARERYNQLLQSLGDDLSTLIPGLTWSWNREVELHPCVGRYEDTRGVSVWTASLVASAAIPDSAWPRALELVKARADELGASEVTAYVDRPGNHSVALHGNGAVIRLLSDEVAVLTARSDCYLREADLQAG